MRCSFRPRCYCELYGLDGFRVKELRLDAPLHHILGGQPRERIVAELQLAETEVMVRRYSIWLLPVDAYDTVTLGQGKTGDSPADAAASASNGDFHFPNTPCRRPRM